MDSKYITNPTTLITVFNDLGPTVNTHVKWEVALSPDVIFKIEGDSDILVRAVSYPPDFEGFDAIIIDPAESPDANLTDNMQMNVVSPHEAAESIRKVLIDAYAEKSNQDTAEEVINEAFAPNFDASDVRDWML